MVYKGEAESFDNNWKIRSEAHYLHWTRGQIKNQIQFAFRNHWEVFSELMTKAASFNGGKRVLEVGCGRGSLSAYFSDAGYNCTLLDISAEAIKIAEEAFSKNDLNAEFHVGDAESLSFSDMSFDIVFSIGLLEHFEILDSVISEQVRVLDSGGLWFGYIVPKYIDNIQKDYNWINTILAQYAVIDNSTQPVKAEIFRSDYGSERYLPILEKNGINVLGVSGIYSTPMISHSIDFPFSLMPEVAELEFVSYQNTLLNSRRVSHPKRHPWLCEEGEGNAFLIWGVKK